MKTAYSHDARLGGNGIGFIGYNAVVGIHRAGLPTRLFVSSNVQTTIPCALIAGTVSIRRGVPDLLEAWRQLAWRDAELVLVGAVAPDFAAIRAR